MKGVRQGDPISPLLFVLVMDYLTRLLVKTASRPGFKYHPGCQLLKICNLCFADDLLLFCKGIVLVVRIVLDMFECFSECIWLVANESKSSIYFGGVPERVQQEILMMSGFRKGIFLMRYLGVPLSPKRWSKLDCHTVVAKITARIDCWSAHHLTYAERYVLVQSVLQALNVYWDSFFFLASSICTAVDQRCRDFLWGAKRDKRRVPLVQWHNDCSAKPKGGPGLMESRL